MRLEAKMEVQSKLTDAVQFGNIVERLSKLTKNIGIETYSFKVLIFQPVFMFLSIYVLQFSGCLMGLFPVSNLGEYPFRLRDTSDHCDTNYSACSALVFLFNA